MAAKGETVIVSTGDQSATITDDDEPTATSISVVPATIAENGGQSTVTVRLAARDSSGTVVLPITFSGSAAFVSDYTVRGPIGTTAAGNKTQLLFAQGVTEQTFTVTGVADRKNEQDETVIVAVCDQTTTISLTNVFKESVLADVCRIGSFALLRRNSDRFARLTGDVVGAAILAVARRRQMNRVISDWNPLFRPSGCHTRQQCQTPAVPMQFSTCLANNGQPLSWQQAVIRCLHENHR